MDRRQAKMLFLGLGTLVLIVVGNVLVGVISRGAVEVATPKLLEEGAKGLYSLAISLAFFFFTNFYELVMTERVANTRLSNASHSLDNMLVQTPSPVGLDVAESSTQLSSYDRRAREVATQKTRQDALESFRSLVAATLQDFRAAPPLHRQHLLLQEDVLTALQRDLQSPEVTVEDAKAHIRKAITQLVRN